MFTRPPVLSKRSAFGIDTAHTLRYASRDDPLVLPLAIQGLLSMICEGSDRICAGGCIRMHGQIQGGTT